MDIELTATVIAAKAQANRASVQYALVRQQQKLEQSLQDMVANTVDTYDAVPATNPAALPESQGTLLDKSA